jgi:NAD(P)-dependent dehydrogenase (short-subunit alcohol dehydrogenase family)
MPSTSSIAGRLAGRVAVVTGGAQGIGLAYVRRFLAEGAAVTVADIVDPAPSVAALGAGDRLLGVTVDVRSAAATVAMAEATRARFGRIDVLVNNAAVFAALRPQSFDAIPAEEWERVMAVNVTGVWNATKAVVPAMRAQGGGRIVNIASAIVPKGTALLLHYVTSKGAVVAMTRALARELAPHGITVNAVAPGLILSDTVQANPDITGFQIEAVRAVRAIKRDGYPEDVEGAVVFLASDDSAFMSGQTLIVDGGSVFSGM